jgi:hypothetical protein
VNADGRTGFGIGIGGAGAVLVAAGLVSVRDSFAAVNVVLILVLLVLLGATIGGRIAGIVSALAAALSFDFFFTQPYNSLKINNAADIETTILLLVVGLIIGEIAVRADRIRFAVAGNRRDLSRLHRVARLAADGENVDDMISAVSAELTATLGLHDCIYERPPFHGDYPTLKPTGALTGHGLRYFTHDGYELPREGVELPLVVHDQTVGRFVLLPTAGRGVSLDRRMIAATLADQLSVVLARRAA